jgi:hypothetical protein
MPEVYGMKFPYTPEGKAAAKKAKAQGAPKPRDPKPGVTYRPVPMPLPPKSKDLKPRTTAAPGSMPLPPKPGKQNLPMKPESSKGKKSFPMTSDAKMQAKKAQARKATSRKADAKKVAVSSMRKNKKKSSFSGLRSQIYSG